MLLKLLSMGASGLVGLALLGPLASPDGSDEPPSPPKKKGDFFKNGEAEKKEPGPEGDLHRAYNLLRRLRAEGQTGGRPEGRIRDWTERATRYYRDGVKALEERNPQLAHEYGAIAHDLARAIEHARNAALFDRPDEDLPRVPGKAGSGRDGEARRQLTKAYERLKEGDDGSDAGPEAKFYRDAAVDLYRAARRDAEAGRTERAGELARAAEAMTHVAEHLGHAADDRTAPPSTAEPKVPSKAERKAKCKGKGERLDDILPPPYPD